MASSSRDSHRRDLEEGELSQGDSPAKTPLKKIHDKKVSTLNAQNVKDSIQRKRRRSKKPSDYETESDGSDFGSSSCLESSVIQGLKKKRKDEISIRQAGLLDDPAFMHEC